MINENAPSFGPSGDGLAASYALNFNADLSHYILLESTWQGDRKRARTIYFDNYNNNFAINVNLGSAVKSVPAYSTGYISLDGFDVITIVSTAAGTCNVTLYTDAIEPGFSARGNPPNVVSVVPFSVQGNVNLATGNQAVSMCYNSDLSRMYVGTQSGLIVTINTVTNKVIAAVNVGKICSCMVYAKTGFIIAGTSTGYLIVFKISDSTFNTYSTVNVTSGTGIKSICYADVNNTIFFTDGDVNALQNYSMAGAYRGAVITGINARQCVYVDEFKAVYVLSTISSNYVLYQFFVVTGVGSGVGLNSQVSNVEMSMTYNPTNKFLYYGQSNSTVVFRVNASTMVVDFTSYQCGTQSIIGLKYNADNNCLYASNTASCYVFDCLLNGVVGQITGMTGNLQPNCIETNGKLVYVGSNNALVYYME